MVFLEAAPLVTGVDERTSCDALPQAGAKERMDGLLVNLQTWAG